MPEENKNHQAFLRRMGAVRLLIGIYTWQCPVVATVDINAVSQTRDIYLLSLNRI